MTIRSDSLPPASLFDGDQVSGTLDDVFLAMIEAAVAAPSPDNNQPWRFQTERDCLQVYLDRSRSLPSDEGSMFDMTAVGAAVENAVIAASQHGCSSKVTWLGLTDGSDAPVVEVRLGPECEPDPLANVIFERCTCRKPYARQALAVRQLEALSLSVREFPETRIDWISEPGPKSRFGSLIAQTDSLRFRTRPFHEELFRQLRFRTEEVNRSRDGLDVRTLELPPGVTVALRSLRRWWLMRTVHALRLTPLLTMPSKQAVKNSGAIAVVTVESASPQNFMIGGRAIQRLWLTAAATGLSMHPLGSLPIFLLQRDPKPEFRELIRGVREATHQLLPTLEDRVIQLAFRVGYGAPPSARSLRRPVVDVFGR